MEASELVEELAARNAAHVEASVGHVPIHAGAVETSAGVIALAGRSRSGKSTLVAAAVMAGNRYVADEITAVSPEDLSVRPYHRPIGLRREGAEAIGVAYPDQPEYGVVYPWDVSDSQALSDGGRLAGIVLVAWRAGAAAALDDVSPALAMTELTEHAVVDDENYRPAFDGLERLVRAVPVVRATYSTTTQSLELLRAFEHRLNGEPRLRR